MRGVKHAPPPRTLSDEARLALSERGPEGDVSMETFSALADLGWGYWEPDYDDEERRERWVVTDKGREALRQDDLRRAKERAS